jgi:hypothetical protein
MEGCRLRVFENMLRGGGGYFEVARGSRKLHIEELHNFYSSPNFVRVIKSRRMRRAGSVARKGERERINIYIHFGWKT